MRDLSWLYPFHSHTLMQLFVEPFIPTKFPAGLFYILTLIFAKSTEVALQTQHSKPTTEFPVKQFVDTRGKFPCQPSCYVELGYRPSLIQRFNTGASHGSHWGSAEFFSTSTHFSFWLYLLLFLLTDRLRSIIWDSCFTFTEGIQVPISEPGGHSSLTGLFL